MKDRSHPSPGNHTGGRPWRPLGRNAASALLLIAPIIGLTGCGGTDPAPIPLEDPPPRPIPNPDPGEILSGPAISAARPPAPISGGGLWVLGSDVAIVSDTDADRVLVVDLRAAEVRSEFDLPADAEPGRLAADSDGNVTVALRGTGQVVRFHPDAPEDRQFLDVCLMPRGVSFDPLTNHILVACRGGQLMSLTSGPASNLAVARVVQLDRDLRDVVRSGDTLFATRFKTAEVLELDADGVVTARHAMPEMRRFSFFDPNKVHRAAVAWRAVAHPEGGLAIVHQTAAKGPVVLDEPGAYGSFDPCEPGIVASAVTRFDNGVFTTGPMIPANTLPVDIALTADGEVLAVASGAARGFHPRGLTTLDSTRYLAAPDPTEPPADCFDQLAFNHEAAQEIVAVAFAANGALVKLQRDPFVLEWGAGRSLALSEDVRNDSGHRVFHMSAGGSLACASCHPEGTEDGLVWVFDPIGPRRSQNLEGGLSGTEPFHWDGDMESIHHLADEVFTGRMSGPFLLSAYPDALLRWLDTVPAPITVPSVDSEAVARGRAAFEEAECTSCHSGPQFGGTVSADVGTGGTFQAPRLTGVAFRAPFMHDGCAPTLRDRFGACGGGTAHGRAVSSESLDDLLAYLESL